MSAKSKPIDDQLHWYKDAVIYELHIKAFRDSDCDGVGDFNGLIEKLDYLQGFGITAIWLLPFYPSPLKDDGYDIEDYYSINPLYGNIRQFKKLLKEAHKRGLKVITELVINHTSDNHPWFKRARNAPKGSKERDYYVWTDDPNQYKDARIIFQDFEKSNWTWDPVAQQYYWHRFFHHQPDLNYDNPKVQEEVFKIIDYWCDMGVDGFRLDAVPYLFEREGTNCENLPETHAFLKRLRAHIDENYPGTLMLAEANMWPEDAAHYFGDGDECQMNYHFPIMPRLYMALQMEERYPITDIIEQTPDIPAQCQWALFLRNHDELTLEMVTDEERDYMYKIYVRDPRAKINLGIRHRLAPLMGNNRTKIELLNFLLFSLPGTPVLYYGDEIGMGDNFYLGDRDGVRTPMQWSLNRNAGFSEANPQQLYLPIILDPLYHYEHVNVELANKDTSSLLWFMRRLINTRKKHKAFSRGDIKFINTDNAKILACTRTYEDETILIIVNLSRFPQPAELELADYKGFKPVEIFSNSSFPIIKENTPYLFTLSQYECQWFQLKNTAVATDADAAGTPALQNTWTGTLSRGIREELENAILPSYLMTVRWFGGKGKSIQTISILDYTILEPADDNPVILLLVSVTYNSDLPEIYQLPIAYAGEHQTTAIRQSYPSAIICEARSDKDTGALFDALYSEPYQQLLIKLMAAHHQMHIRENESIHFIAVKSMKEYVKKAEKIKSRPLSAEQSNSSIIYDNIFFMKLYRKVDRTINPDLEISRFLTQETKFKNIPPFIGSIEWKSPHGNIVLAMMQHMIDNTTDGWTYMLDRLAAYNEKILSKIEANVSVSDNKTAQSNTDIFEDLPQDIKELLEANVVERMHTLGTRTAELHLALASSNDIEAFKPEEFSLHYQRSLFSSFQTLMRVSYQALSKNMAKLPDDISDEAKEILGMKDIMLEKFRTVYSKKYDSIKIRIHGDYHLGQVLFTGNDVYLIDFEGEPARTYSERRIKRSALRDVAGMLRSFHYAAYASLFLNNNLKDEDIQKLVPYVEQWQQYMCGFFLQSYLKTINGSRLIPQNEDDFKNLLSIYMLEKAVYEVGYELNNRPNWVIIPIRGIKAILNG